MTSRKEIHHLIDRIPDSQLPVIRDFLETLNRKVSRLEAKERQLAERLEDLKRVRKNRSSGNSWPRG